MHLSKHHKLLLPSKHKYDPLPVVENESAKILQDFSLQTDVHASSNQPDIVLLQKQELRIVFLSILS